MKVEELAKIFHESGREAVEKKQVVNPNTHSKFLEWDELEEHMKEGRRIQARYILERFNLTNRKGIDQEFDELYCHTNFQNTDCCGCFSLQDIDDSSRRICNECGLSFTLDEIIKENTFIDDPNQPGYIIKQK